jgi:hypothetical protein
MWFGSQAMLTRVEARLAARREQVSRLLARKPVTSFQEVRRQAFIKGALDSVETHSRLASAYKAHVEAIHQALTRGAETSAVTPSSTAGEIGMKAAKGDLGDV